MEFQLAISGWNMSDKHSLKEGIPECMKDITKDTEIEMGVESELKLI
jgi:hypothetical protein